MAETFPAPLQELAQELWVAPLRAAAAEVIQLTGSASRRQLRRSPVVTAVNGQVVADLQLFGYETGRRRRWKLLDPRPSIRRLGASWRVGRMRGALPALAGTLVRDVDRELAAMPEPAALADGDLLRVLDNAVAYLQALHGHEMLAGALVTDDRGATGADHALRAVAVGRARDWTDDDIVARTPVALTIVAPHLADRPPLPAVDGLPLWDHGELTVREELRLRVRWVHELTRQVVRELGRRLETRGVLPSADDVGRLTLDVLTRALEGAEIEVPPPSETPPVPVPSRFRLSSSGEVVSEALADGQAGQGVGAGGGRQSGPVAFAEPRPGDVLVVQTLDPGLAPVLPRLAGIVAETGSPLSHLAILAREHGVAIVVGAAGALERFRPGQLVVVDGHTGAVDVVGDTDEIDGAGVDGSPEVVVDVRASEPVDQREVEV